MAKKPDEPGNPFKTKKSAGKTSTLATYQTKGETAVAVDEYHRIKKEIKRLEGEVTPQNNAVLSEVRAVFAARLMKGEEGNLTIIGKKETLTFITQNSGSELTDDDLNDIEKTFGKEAVEALTELNISGLKFNPSFIGNAETQEKLVAVLKKAFPKEFPDMFLPLGHKVKDDTVTKAPGYVKSADQLAALYSALKLKSYIKTN